MHFLYMFFFVCLLVMSTNWAAICTISWGLRELYEQILYELDLQHRQSSRRRLHPVDWRYHIGDDVFVTIKAPYVCTHQKALYSHRWMDLPSHQERCGFTRLFSKIPFHTLDMLKTSRKTRLSSLTVWIRMTRDCNAHIMYSTWAYVKQTNNTFLTFILQVCSIRNGSKRVDWRFWKDDTVPTKEGVSLHLDQWKALCNMSDVIDDLLTRVTVSVLALFLPTMGWSVSVLSILQNVKPHLSW
jgi:hypothetical protein